MKRVQGFTIIEIVIALMIVAIMAMMAVPSFQKWIYHLNFTGFARDVYTEFQQGRQRAIATGIAHTVVVEPANDSVRLLRANDNAYVRNDVKAPKGCDIVSGTNVTFNPDGSASSNGNVRIVNLYSSVDNQAITVTLGTGRIRFQ